jgi:hypothetical protein
VDRIDPIAPDRSVQRVDLTYLTPLERRRRNDAPRTPRGPRQDGESAPAGGIDVRA